MIALAFVCCLLWSISYASANKFYKIFDEQNYPIGRIIPIGGILIGIGLYFDVDPDPMYSGTFRIEALLALVYGGLTGIIVNTISFLYGKRQYHDPSGKNTAGYAFLTLINIGSMIGSILGIVELYLKHKM
jgi:phage shock protein PspC (stress-responsive transcriptional regulator)